MNFKTYLIATSLLMSAHAFAQSIPMKNTTCGSDVKVQAVPNGNGVFFDADCKVAYVLPPIKAHAAIDSIASTYNLPQCEEWNEFNQTALDVARRIKDITDQLNNQSAVGEGSFGPSGTGPVGGGPFAGSSAPGAAPYAPKWTPAMAEEMKQIRELYANVRELRKTFDGVMAAKAHFLYELKTEDLVAAYRAANPRIQFTAMPLSSAYLTFDRVEKSDVSAGSPVLSLNVPGLGKLPMAPDQNDMKPQGARVDPVDPQVDLKYSRIFGGSLSGSMELSLAGACPYYDAASQTMPKKLSEKDLTAYLTANIQYSYALQAYRSYRASYNLSVLVTRIVKSETEGGFFSSKTINSFVDDEKTNDWFRFESESNDPKFYYPYIVEEVKASLIDRVMKQITLAKVGGPIEVTGLASPKPDGAATAASALHQCPNLYCQAAGFVLDVADSIFGSSSAVNKFIENNDFWSHDDVTERKMLEYYGSAGAVGDQTTL